MKALFKISVLFVCFLLLLDSTARAQSVKLEEKGYRFLKTLYKKDTVNLVVVSKPGEENKRKPVILIEKGSLPIPLLTEYDGQGYNAIMPFNSKILTQDYHLVFVSKPGVPVIVNVKSLSPRGEYLDPKTGAAPLYYSERNNLDYYAGRDAQVFKFLKKQPWVDKNKMVAAGHSEGGPIVAKLATISKDVTHVISSSANPFGQMATIMAQIRADEDSAGIYAKDQLDFWEKIVNKSTAIPMPPGYQLDHVYNYQYGFNLPAYDNFQKLKIPVLISYGTKDYSAPFNDYMHVAMIRDKKKNFTFNAYQGLDHNYFKLQENKEPVIDFAGWKQVAEDWKTWLERH